MTWNWQQPDWPHFRWRQGRFSRAEEQFLVGGGVVLGAVGHLDPAARQHLEVQFLSEEAVTSSEIEGELLDRASVQSSVRRHLGLQGDARRARPAEDGIAEVMVDLFRTWSEPLTSAQLFRWHEHLMRGRRDLRVVGAYRTHDEPMQIVSGRLDRPTVHFEAPPSDRVPDEMNRFIDWYEASGPRGAQPLPAVTRAGVAHLYFESIHPFEDGNGRIGRLVSERALAEGLEAPACTAIAATMLRRRRQYYDTLEQSHRSNDIEAWLAWFAGIVLEAQARTRARVEFAVATTKLMDRVRGQLNARQEKVVRRLVESGPGGFEGGLSAGNYQRITKTSPATAGRDLADLVAKGALTRTGALRHTRYQLAIDLQPVSPVRIDDDGRVIAGDSSAD